MRKVGYAVGFNRDAQGFTGINVKKKNLTLCMAISGAADLHRRYHWYCSCTTFTNSWHSIVSLLLMAYPLHYRQQSCGMYSHHPSYLLVFLWWPDFVQRFVGAASDYISTLLLGVPSRVLHGSGWRYSNACRPS